MSYTLKFLPAAERALDAFAPDEAVRLQLWLMAICEDPRDAPGVQLSGYQPPTFAAEVPGTELFATFVVFQASRQVVVLKIEAFP